MPGVCSDVATKTRSSMDVCLGVGGRETQVILSMLGARTRLCYASVCDPLLAIQAHESPTSSSKVPCTGISLCIRPSAKGASPFVLRNGRATRIQTPGPVGVLSSAEERSRSPVARDRIGERSMLPRPFTPRSRIEVK